MFMDYVRLMDCHGHWALSHHDKAFPTGKQTFADFKKVLNTFL